MMLSINPIHEKDYAAWRQMYSDYQKERGREVDDQQWKKVLNSFRDPSMKLFCIGALKSGDASICAFGHYTLFPSTYTMRMSCYIADLYVTPDSRRQGIAQNMINFLISLGRENSWKNVFWKTKFDNHTAISVYDKIADKKDYIYYDFKL